MTARNDAGFTLMELLVSMTLLAMLSVVLFGGLRFGVQIWHRSETATADINRVRSVQAQIAALVAQAYPFLIVNGPADAQVAFEGNRSGMAFLAPDPNRPGALDRVTIAGRNDGSTITLLQSTRGELDVNTDAAEHTLLKGLGALEFSYFGVAANGEPPQWYEDWHHRAAAPQLVRIRARFADKSAPHWPDMIAPLRITADVACKFDPLTQYCAGRQ